MNRLRSESVRRQSGIDGISQNGGGKSFLVYFMLVGGIIFSAAEPAQAVRPLTRFASFWHQGDYHRCFMRPAKSSAIMNAQLIYCTKRPNEFQLVSGYSQTSEPDTEGVRSSEPAFVLGMRIFFTRVHPQTKKYFELAASAMTDPAVAGSRHLLVEVNEAEQSIAALDFSLGGTLCPVMSDLGLEDLPELMSQRIANVPIYQGEWVHPYNDPVVPAMRFLTRLQQAAAQSVPIVIPKPNRLQTLDDAQFLRDLNSVIKNKTTRIMCPNH